jgi:hydrogenase expression/formation protein HypC
MCLGIPGRVVEMVDEARGIAEVEMSGSRRRVSLVLLTGADRPAPGDFVMVHAGLAMSRVDEGEALEITRMLEGFGEPVGEPEPAA